MKIKRVLYMRSGPYKPDITMYNMQEIGFAKAFLKKGISTDILYFSDKTKKQLLLKTDDGEITILWEKGYKILRTGFYPRFLNKDFLAKYDLIILTEFSQIMTPLVSKRHNNCVLYTGPYYNLFKVPPVQPVYNLLFRKTINRNIGTIFTKSKLTTRYMSKMGYQNLVTLGVGLDTEKYDNEHEILEDTQQLIDLMNKKKCILYVGSLIDRKNFPFTLQVFSILKKRYHLDYNLVIIGDGKENYVKKHFSSVPKDVRRSIIHIKNLPNAQLKFIYPLADFFILPSKLEIFGMVMLEAMYFGSIVLTTVNGGSSTLINDCENGCVFNSFNADEWAKRINALSNTNRISKMKKSAQMTIRNAFLWDNLADEFLMHLRRNNDG